MKEKIVLNSNAVILRKKFGIDPISPVDVFSLINDHKNLTLVFMPMSEKISGMCVITKSGEKVIAINSTLSYGRQRFTASHELYHIYYQENFKGVICGKEIGGGKHEEEKNADAFASFFLAAYEALNDFIGFPPDDIHHREPISLSDVINIEQHFGMSRLATVYRLQDDGYILPDFSETLKVNVIQSARKFGYDDKLYIPTAVDNQYLTTGSYILLAEKLKDSNKISQGKYEELLLDAYRSDIVYNLNIGDQEKYD